MGSERTVDHRLAARTEHGLLDGEAVEGLTFYEDLESPSHTTRATNARQNARVRGAVGSPNGAFGQLQVRTQTQTQGVAVTGAADVLRLMKEFLDTSRNMGATNSTGVTTLLEVLSSRYPQMKSVFEKFRTAFDGSAPVDMQQLMQELSGMQAAPPAPANP